MKIKLNSFILFVLITNLFVLSEPVYGMERFSEQERVHISKKLKDRSDHQCIQTVIGELEKCKEAAQNRVSQATVRFDKIESEQRNLKTWEEADRQAYLDVFQIIGPDIDNLVTQHTIMLTHNITSQQLGRILEIMIEICCIKHKETNRALLHMDRTQGIKDGQGFDFSQDSVNYNKNALSSQLDDLNYPMSLNGKRSDNQREASEYNKKKSLKIIKNIIIENMESYKDIHNKPHPLWGEFTGVLSSDVDTSGSLSDMFSSYKDTSPYSLLNTNAPVQQHQRALWSNIIQKSQQQTIGTEIQEDDWQSQQAQERWWRDYEDCRDGDY